MQAFVDTFVGVANRLLSLASTDLELRVQLRDLARAFLEATADREKDAAVTVSEVAEAGSVAGEVISLAEPSVATAPAELSDVAVTPAETAFPELTLGRFTPAVEAKPAAYPAHWATTTDGDLSLIESRCRLKAEASRWAASRRRLIDEGADFSVEIQPLDRDIIARAKSLTDCFLWMCTPKAPSPTDPRRFEKVADCFEVVADAVSLIRQINEEPESLRDQFAKSLDLLAEAQSALRASISSTDGPVDNDQAQVFNWLKATANQDQRYMRADDSADPTQSEDLSARIETVDSQMQEFRKQVKQRRRLLGKIRHKLGLIANDPDGAEENWRIIAHTIAELVGGGLPPSNRELRELLLPAIDSLPDLDDVTKEFDTVLREIDRFIASYPPQEKPRSIELSPQVRQVAGLLAGRSVVLIGGQRRPGSHEALKTSLGLSDLTWVETRGHEPTRDFESHIARPEVALVLLAIRWSSHSFGDVQQFCDKYRKPLVRLPGGYNPNQVAQQILNQCSDRL